MKRLFFFLILFSVLAMNAFAVETLPLSATQIEKLRAYLPAADEGAALIWKGDPLSIALPLQTEKRLIFPEPIEANLNSALNSDQLRIINNDQSLYLTALKPFAATRLYVTLKESNKIVLLDISTSDAATSATRTVKLFSTPRDAVGKVSQQTAALSRKNTLQEVSVEGSDQGVFAGSADRYVGAIRFAWQQLYAPERLARHSPEFARTPLHTQQWVNHLVYGDKVLAHPEASWSSGDLYVTAIELRNKYAHPTTLHLQSDLCGQWQAATLYPHTQLKPAGVKAGDSTTLFLISNKPFGDMLEGCHGSA